MPLFSPALLPTERDDTWSRGQTACEPAIADPLAWWVAGRGQARGAIPLLEISSQTSQRIPCSMSLAGRLEDLALADIFQILSIGKKTGVFTLKGSRGSALIVFRAGLIVRAETDDLPDNLGSVLLAAGRIKEPVLMLAAEVKKKLPSKSLAEVLLEFGAVQRELLEQATRKRIEHVICKLLLWEDGDFQFDPDDLTIEGKTDLADLGWELSKGLSPEYLLMEGARVHDESSQASASVEASFSLDEPAGDAAWDADWDAVREERKDIAALRSLTQELRFPNSTSEITLLILRFASDIFTRGLLFMVGKTQIVGLGQFGMEIDRADERIRETALSLDEGPFINRIVMEQVPYKGPLGKDPVTGRLVELLGGHWPPEVGVFPVVTEGRTVALLLCDNASPGAGIGETEGLEIFISHAGLALEKALLQRRLQELERKRDLS